MCLVETMGDATNHTEQIVNSDMMATDCLLSVGEVYAKGNPSREHLAVNETRLPQHVRMDNREQLAMNETRFPQHVRQRTSLDESNNTPWVRPHSDTNQTYFPGHRRVRSGDAVAWGIQPANYGNQGYPAYTPRVQPPSMTHSMSMINIPTLPPNIGTIGARYPSNYQSPQRTQMTHSMSVDTCASHINELITKQTASFVKLQNAIVKATQYAEQLEQDIGKGEIELNALLNVKTTSKDDCQRIKTENEYLKTEIHEMVAELDKLGIPLGPYGATSSAARCNPIEPADLSRILKNYEDPLVRPYVNLNESVRIRTHLPPVTVQPPPYSSVTDPVPRYDSINNFQPPAPVLPPKNNTPPPLPPRPQRSSTTNAIQPIPNSPNVADQLTEHWTCPKCTFKNLLVMECEVCVTPRPVTLNRPH